MPSAERCWPSGTIGWQVVIPCTGCDQVTIDDELDIWIVEVTLSRNGSASAVAALAAVTDAARCSTATPPGRSDARDASQPQPQHGRHGPAAASEASAGRSPGASRPTPDTRPRHDASALAALGAGADADGRSPAITRRRPGIQSPVPAVEATRRSSQCAGRATAATAAASRISDDDGG